MHFILVLFYAIIIIGMSTFFAFMSSHLLKTELNIETINLFVTAIFGSVVILGFGVNGSR
jgi:hypothetical protein